MIRLQRSLSPLVFGLILPLTTVACGGDDGESTSGGTTSSTSTTTYTPTGNPADARTFDHTLTGLEQIPESCINQIKSSDFVFHYVHRSHGGQITSGAESLEAKNPLYGFEAEVLGIPDETDVLKVWDGMRTYEDSNRDEGYWSTPAGIEGVRAILSENPSIKYSMWAWSYEISAQTEQTVDQYLTVMSQLEEEFPDVTFVYMTGTAEEEYEGVNRTQRNQQIREYAQTYGKILYDFEDLDAWYGDDHSTRTVGGVEIPMEHPRYVVDDGSNGYEYSHTTQESCENKARAFWVMVAALEGCAG
ncbi:hypothetical protein [Chondromyces crocatus]|uniref:Uncharacterized protein n=1 Tax=Chondromyces crocatus TaxID=52 RepID=A0A0K1ESM6_CHOCO|nr:hypothetical protein [Chondromyces crocatus]AKT43642.1 uncharacterized protein CMC5_078770 [Chondromyces crocatus]